MELNFKEKIDKAVEGNSPVNLKKVIEEEYKGNLSKVDIDSLLYAKEQILKTIMVYPGNKDYITLIKHFLDNRN